MLTYNQRNRMRQTQVAHMGDQCIPLIWTDGRDEDGQETGGSYEPGTGSVCAYQPKGSREANTLQVTTQDQIRLPSWQAGVLTSHDRIQITALYGEAVDPPIEFQVDGDPRNGPTAVICPVIRITT